MTAGSTRARRGNAPAVHPLGARRRIAVAAIWLATLAGAIALASARQLIGGELFEGNWTLVFIGLAVDVLAFASVGAILMIRRPDNRVGLILLVAAVLVALSFLGFLFGAALATNRGTQDRLAGLVALLGSLGIFPTLIMAGPMLALVLPDGHLPGPRWRWPVRAIAAAVVLGSASVLVQPGPLGDSLADNPFGVTGVGWLNAVSGFGLGLYTLAVPGSLLLALVGVAYRFRRSRGVEREQLKWFVAAIVAFVVFLLLSFSDGATGDPTVFDLLAVWSLSLSPIAIGIAILRYRLYEIDRIISRTLAYAMLTVLLLGVYVAGFLLVQTVIAPFVRGGGSVAVAASTLVVFALFQPLRRRIQAATDRRFNRSRYDAQQTVEAFAARLRDEVDLARLRVALVDTVEDAVRPVSTAVWLRVGSGGR